MGRREDVSQPGGRVVAVVVVCAVDMWAVIVPSTYPQHSESTLRNRENDLTKFTEKDLHNPAVMIFHLMTTIKQALYLV